MRPVRPLLLCLLVLASVAAPRPAAADELSLENLEFKYEVERERLGKPMAMLDEAFKSQLEKLEEQVVAEGVLERVLLVREELKLLGKPGHAEAGGFAELKRLQGIYDKESAKRIAERDAKLDELMGQHLEELGQLQTELTKAKKIDAAVAAGERIKTITDARAALAAAKPEDGSPGSGVGDDGAELKWQAVGDAKLVTSEKDPGSAGVESTKAVDLVHLAKPLPTKFTLKGELHIKGPWAGFAVGLDPRARDFLSVYSNNRAGTRQERVLGGARKVLEEEEKVKWKHDSWERFELVRDSDQWSLKVGTRTLEFRLPDGINGRYVGLVSYPNSTIVLRKLSLTKD